MLQIGSTLTLIFAPIFVRSQAQDTIPLVQSYNTAHKKIIKHLRSKRQTKPDEHFNTQPSTSVHREATQDAGASQSASEAPLRDPATPLLNKLNYSRPETALRCLYRIFLCCYCCYWCCVLLIVFAIMLYILEFMVR